MTHISTHVPHADQPEPQLNMAMNLRDPGSFYRQDPASARPARSRGRPPSP